MITGSNKTKIDKVWNDLWTAGLTNSFTVMEQITYLLFMKMLDDRQLQKERNANALGTKVVNPLFIIGQKWHNPETGADVEYKNLRWSVFKLLPAEERFRTVRNDVFSFIKNIDSGEDTSYSRFMQDAVFAIPDARTLTKVVEGINDLETDNLDMMGDVYEYVLGKMAESGTNGQFRTPRHIIRMIVELMKPTPDDKICDPAMGSAGFLVEAAKFVKDEFGNELHEDSTLDYYQTSMFNGFDTDPTMLRIGAMNLRLHDVAQPHIERRDSLSADNTDVARYSLIMANPPFAGSLDSETVADSLKVITNTKKTELLFMSLFIRMLVLGGRCASIVPDGVLFGNSKAHLSLRKELIDHQRLQAVISMPSGVFQPYAGVSTAIIIFTKTNAGGTDKVWFYDMQADGFSLDQRRQEVEENDIPDVIARFNNLEGEESRTRKDKSFLVPVKEIQDNDYVLSMNKYKEVEREVVEYEKPDVILGRIESLETEISEALKEFRVKFL